MLSYGFKKSVSRPVAEVEEAARQALSSQGFGVLTRIDMHEKFREKLDVDFRKCVILGACSPPNAYAAVQAEEDIGLMLPCNVVLYETDGGSNVSIIKPSVAMNMIENDALADIARKVEEKLEKVFNDL